MSKGGRRKDKLNIEILQNGYPIVDGVWSLRWRNIRLSKWGPFGIKIPFYKLDSGLRIGRLTKNGLKLKLSDPWRGFVSTGTTIQTLTKNHRSHNVYLKPRDFASLWYKDLRVLIRIGPAPVVTASKDDAAYRLPLFRAVAKDHDERVGILAGLGIAGFLAGCVVFGFMMRPDDRPRSIWDLSDDYLLPFVDPRHIANAPEELQSKIDRAHLVKSVVEYNREFTNLVAGLSIPDDPRYMFGSSVDLYRKLHGEVAVKVDALRLQQTDIDARSEATPTRAVLRIPTVVGESAMARSLQVVDKMNLAHESFALNLKLRKPISQEFQDDNPYEYAQYKSAPSQGFDDDTRKFLARIRPWNEMTDEERMYWDARHVSMKARWLRDKIKKARALDDVATADDAANIILPGTSQFMSFISQTNKLINEDKARRLSGSEITRESPAGELVTREPLTGAIDPKLVESAIRKRRYELQMCFELALKRDQDVRGTVAWKWRIDTRGQITDLTLVSSTISDQAMISCLRRKIVSWRFPPPDHGSVEVNFPFEFIPAKG